MDEGIKLTPQQAAAVMLQKLLGVGEPTTAVNLGDGWIGVSKMPNVRVMQKEVEDGVLIAIAEMRVGRDDSKVFPNGRLHISISHNSKLRQQHEQIGEANIPKRIPNWEEIKQVRQKFAPAELNMAIMFPPPEKYVNIHSTCIHLLQIPVELALDPGPLGAI